MIEETRKEKKSIEVEKNVGKFNFFFLIMYLYASFSFLSCLVLMIIRGLRCGV